jgi:hypothetical protein
MRLNFVRRNVVCNRSYGQLTAISFPLSSTSGPVCTEASIKVSIERYIQSVPMFMEKCLVYSYTSNAERHLLALQSETHFETDNEPINTFNLLKRYQFALC